MLPIEVFAIGCSGYGTLQEYLIMDRYIDAINPDAVVVRFCYNDFINNSCQLERMSDTHNNGMRRPYWNLSGELEYALSAPFPRKHRAGPDAQVYLFSVDKISPYHEALMEATAGAGVRLINGIPDAVHDAEKRGLETRSKDGMHWNETGHRIAAEQLMNVLSAYGK